MMSVSGKDTKMQARHFNLIAETIDSLDCSYTEKVEIAAKFAKKLKQTNPKFDALRFVEASTANSWLQSDGTFGKVGAAVGAR